MPRLLMPGESMALLYDAVNAHWGELAPRLEGRLIHLKLWETKNNVFEYNGGRNEH